MELAGDEKRIQALFSEVRLEHQRSAPQFVKVWNTADTTPARVPVFNRSVVMLGCVLVLVAFGAFVWLWRENATPADARDEMVQPQVLATVVESPQKVQKRTVSLPTHRVVHRKPARRLNIERAVVQNAAVLSKWQSPTDTLMKSSVASLLNALPALNESAKDLESYLSNNELKELKQ
jgi:hypothetical protein